MNESVRDRENKEKLKEIQKRLLGKNVCTDPFFACNPFLARSYSANLSVAKSNLSLETTALCETHSISLSRNFLS